LKIAVMIKQVPSSEARVRIAADGRSLDPAEVQFVVNPYDEYAMEAALQLKEKFGGEVIAISAGTPKAEEALRTCLALGADRALLVRDDALQGADSLGTARALAAACKKAEAELILCGKLSIDQENSAVGVQVAGILGFPHVSVVTKLEVRSETALRVHREIEGGMEVYDVRLPAVLTANKGLNEPRYASLKGIMAAKKKPLETVGLSALGVDPGEVAGRSTLTALEYPPPRGEGKVVKDEARESVRQLVGWLRDQAKVL
jgi:electron transfer flavoprotein beta subunit